MDAPLTALLLELSRAGWRTIVSCLENGEGIVRISFGSAADVGAFLDVTAPSDRGDDVSERARARWGKWRKSSEGIQLPGPGEAWAYAQQAEDVLEARSADTSFEIFLPAEDMATVLERLRRATAAAGSAPAAVEPPPAAAPPRIGRG